MAVIGRIRKRVGLLIGVVGVSMLLFILGDLVTSNTGLMNSNSDVLGEIGGEKIRYQEFERRVDQLTENYKLNTRTENIDQNTTDMLRDQAWNMYVNDFTLGKEYEKLGISCSADELFDMVAGKNPHPQVQQAFTDPNTKMFDKNAVMKFLKDLPNREDKVQQQWKNFEQAIRDERIADKYKTLIRGGLFVTTAEAKANYTDNSRLASIRYVRLDYNTVPDSSVTVEDSDLQSYYSANSSKYRQAETVRKMDYVTFDVTPSAEDQLATSTWINDRKAELTTAEDVAAVVNRNSDSPYDSTYHAKGTLAPAIDTTLFNASAGTVIGPFEDGGAVKVARLMGEKMVSDSVQARHILLSVENGDTAKAMAQADSLKNAIKKGAKFADLAPLFSKDPGSAAKGGDLGWFRQGMMVPSFNDACFNGKVGDMPVVSSQFGVHLIEITGKGVPSRQIRVAVIDRKIEPSQKTYDAVFSKATAFASKITSSEMFDSTIAKEGLNKRVAENVRETDKNIPGLEQPREMVRWAYQAEKGDISKVFTFGDKYVIARLSDIKEKGILPLDDVRDQVTVEARKKKKGEMLAAKIEAASAKSVDELASKLNTAAADADNVAFLNGYIMGIGNEPKVTGNIFGMKQGQLSRAIIGDNGVCVVYVKSFTEPPAVKEYTDSMNQLRDQRKQRSDYEVQAALKEASDIEDNRGRFY
ncbi:MAG: hypothetical protein RL213_1480 [Bacteroidota bacterium]|jgi:peptidyl-prolyl cis-trans isomerase D